MILLGDLHFGIKKFNRMIFNQQTAYLYSTLEYALSHNQSTIFQFGDIIDNKTTMDIEFYHLIVEFFEKFCQDIQFITILGNHDLYYKEGSNLSLIHQIRASVRNFNLIDSLRLIEIEGKSILCVPYNDNNLLSKVDVEVDYVFGHFDIKTFELLKNIKSNQGFEIEDFKKFKGKVLSGHYHKKQQQSNITYIGTPYQINWGEASNVNGFYVLSDELLFVKNEISPRYIRVDVLDETIDVYEETNPRIFYFNEISQIIELYKNDFLKINYTEYNDAIQMLKDRLVNCSFSPIQSRLENREDCDVENETPIELLRGLASNQDTIEILNNLYSETQRSYDAIE